jgi:FAD/FMN-containing dehydrogenase
MTTTDTRIDALREELVALLGEDGVSVDPATRERASIDDALMSPVLAAQLPKPPADIVAYPASAELVAHVVGAAVRHGVPITPRGKGTGNYGQAVPLHRGLVIDMTRANAILELTEDSITAEAGARMIALEQAANREGSQLWMFPSTVQSTLGGFLAGGSGGTGSIVHGGNDAGFVTALDVVYAVPDAKLVHLEGDEVLPFVHAYGTTGIVARATVRIEPAQQWQTVYCSFSEFTQAQSVIRQLTTISPLPRLASADMADLASSFPADAAILPGRASLRMVVDVVSAEAALDLVRAAGGSVDAVREGLQASVKAAMLSYNHPTWWLLKARPDYYFHLEVGGDGLIDNLDAVMAVFPETLMHMESNRPVPHGMLNARFESAEAIEAGIETLAALDVGSHSPHHWELDRRVELARSTAKHTDPDGLLNPGKLPAA